MKITHDLFVLCLAMGLTSSSFGQIAEFNFNGESLTDSANAANLTVSNVSTNAPGSFNSFTSSTGWDVAAQISGASGFFSDPTSQEAAGEAIIFTIAADSGYDFSISEFSFQARSTSTAPSDIGFTINGIQHDFSASYSNNSTITTILQGSLGFSSLTNATIAIQGWNSTSSGALQLDNIQVTGSVVPEPGTFALFAGCLGMTFVMLKRRGA